MSSSPSQVEIFLPRHTGRPSAMDGVAIRMIKSKYALKGRKGEDIRCMLYFYKPAIEALNLEVGIRIQVMYFNLDKMAAIRILPMGSIERGFTIRRHTKRVLLVNVPMLYNHPAFPEGLYGIIPKERYDENMRFHYYEIQFLHR